jgi:type IV secretory pathway VirB10-like protein
MSLKDFAKNIDGADFDFKHLKDWTLVNLKPVGVVIKLSNLVLKGNCDDNEKPDKDTDTPSVEIETPSDPIPEVAAPESTEIPDTKEDPPVPDATTPEHIEEPSDPIPSAAISEPTEIPGTTEIEPSDPDTTDSRPNLVNRDLEKYGPSPWEECLQDLYSLINRNPNKFFDLINSVS